MVTRREFVGENGAENLTGETSSILLENEAGMGCQHRGRESDKIKRLSGTEKAGGRHIDCCVVNERTRKCTGWEKNGELYWVLKLVQTQDDGIDLSREKEKEVR